jgi:hypothetical protein
MHNYYSNDQPAPLPRNYSPGPYDVICARGQEAKNHPGNLFYRSLVNRATEKYGKTPTKFDRTLIVSSIVDEVRYHSFGGGFVKQYLDGQWYEVGDHIAREKVGQNLRDGLSKQYKSSTKAKKRKRELRSAELVCDVENLIRSNTIVSKRIRDLHDQVKMNVPDVFLSQLFTESNIAILEALKQDLTLLQQFKRAEASREASRNRKTI